MNIELKVAVSKDSADYRRMEPNSLWEFIQEDIERFFGPLAVVVKGRLRYDDYLASCYVQEFGAHEDEKSAFKLLERAIEKEDINFYSDLQNWTRKKKPYLNGVIGHYKDFKPLAWRDLHYPRMLCGRKGSGKTTLLLFAKGEIEKLAKVRCIFVSLSSPGFDTDDPCQAIAFEIIHQIEYLTSELSATADLSNKELMLMWHQRRFKLKDAYPNTDDSWLERTLKARLRNNLLIRLEESKYSGEFIPYLHDSIELLENSFGVRLVIMIDDVDRLQCDQTAKNVCDRARNLAVKLANVPVVVSIREETMAKLSDVDHFATRISVIPPSFRRVLRRRLDVFCEQFEMDEHKAQRSGYDTNSIKQFVSHIVESVLSVETYANLIGYHYDIDILLDVVRCLIKSPFIQPGYVLKLINEDDYIPWHIILDSMQRFQYKNFYDENSFILNVFDNDQAPPTMSNTLVRVRLLQVLRHRFQGLNQPIQVGDVFADMHEIGYEKALIVSALQAFARQRLIVTWRARNTFTDEVPEILSQGTIIYYLDSLIYSYRYLQNILPVTHVPFNIPLDLVNITGPLFGDKLKVISERLMRFVEFIRTCEECEQESLKNISLFNEITRGETISHKMEMSLKQAIYSMKEPR